MKKILFLLLFLPVFSLAQSPYIKLDSLKFYKIIDSFIQTTEIPYVQDKESDDSNQYRFYNPDNKEDFLFIIYERDFGDWNIKNLHGTYGSLFKIWKSSFDRNADTELIRKKGFAEKGRTKFEKKPGNKFWSITKL